MVNPISSQSAAALYQTLPTQTQNSQSTNNTTAPQKQAPDSVHLSKVATAAAHVDPDHDGD